MSYLGQRPKDQITRETQGSRQLSVGKELRKLPGPAMPEGSTTVVSAINNPSRRLSGLVEVFFDEDPDPILVGSDATNFAGSNWTIRAQAIALSHARRPLHIVESAVLLPRAYEFDTGVRGILVSTVLAHPLDSGGLAVAGTWYMRCRWEPNTPMSDDEVMFLFSHCALL